jgi:GcrA cell cycle regulator
MRWTDDELRELVALWPTNSAKRIARRLHRPRSAICGKAKRLRAEGVLPDGVHKHFDVVALKARPRLPVASLDRQPASRPGKVQAVSRS